MRCLLPAGLLLTLALLSGCGGPVGESDKKARALSAAEEKELQAQREAEGDGARKMLPHKSTSLRSCPASGRARGTQ